MRNLISTIINSKKNNQHVAKVFQNIIWMLADKAFQLIVGLAVGSWVARYLMPDNFGKISYALAFIGIFQIASEVGINNIAIRELSKKHEPIQDIIGTMFRLRLMSGLTCCAAAILIFYTLGINRQETLLITGVLAMTILFKPSEVIDLLFQSELKSKFTVHAKWFANIFSSTLKILLILFKMPLIAFAIVYTFETIIYSLALIYLYQKHTSYGYGAWNANLAKKILKEGAPFLVSNLLLAAYIQFDKILIAKISNISEAGYYTAALTITSLFNIIPMIICSSLAPTIANLQTEKERIAFFIKLNSIFLWSGLILSFTTYILAKNIVLLLYGHAYEPSILITKILSLAVIPIFLSVSNDYLALSRKNSKTTVIRTIIGLVLSLTLSLILIPEHGAEGAAISILMAHWASNTLLYWPVMRDSFLIHLKSLTLPFCYFKNNHIQ